MNRQLDVIFSAKSSKKRGNAVYLVFPQLDSKSIGLLTYVQRSTAYVTQARDIYIYIFIHICVYNALLRLIITQLEYDSRSVNGSRETLL